MTSDTSLSAEGGEFGRALAEVGFGAVGVYPAEEPVVVLAVDP